MRRIQKLDVCSPILGEHIVFLSKNAKIGYVLLIQENMRLLFLHICSPILGEHMSSLKVDICSPNMGEHMTTF